MGKVKAILYIVGGVLLLVAGFVLRGLLFGRSGCGVKQQLDAARGHSNAAGQSLDDASDSNRTTGELNNSIGGINSELQAGNTLAEQLIRRSRELLAKGTRRPDPPSG